MPRMTGNEGRRRKLSVSLSEDAILMIEQIAAWQGGSYLSHVIEDCVREVHRRLEKENRRSIAKPHARRAPTRAQLDALERANDRLSKRRRAES